MYVDMTSQAEIRYTDEHAPYSVLEGASTGYGVTSSWVPWFPTPPKGYGKFDE